MKVELSLVDADTIAEDHQNGVCVVRNQRHRVSKKSA